jgi:hypothetical protein
MIFEIVGRSRMSFTLEVQDYAVTWHVKHSFAIFPFQYPHTVVERLLVANAVDRNSNSVVIL